MSTHSAIRLLVAATFVAPQLAAADGWAVAGRFAVSGASAGSIAGP